MNLNLKYLIFNSKFFTNFNCDYKIFTTNIYKVLYKNRILYIDKNNSYFINLTGNKINKDLRFNKTIK